ncbi:tRNA (5-methylaminomethyl-2-thiouridine)(34)-methyltransferase MnmD [Lunatimonas salinarum]|uniref:tRNA (5-methylaminomethyl-2-thiouridine)(34)-methyltransferase MnmD n=1 Tax=Lunatimonas salinarum TaxID=1774590 RepID=UPI001ADF8EC1|nr:tRNA (5-methylaminomethyl-2-thiouridine)(34)-methyltransferase MnmD [Lunatimonas salinarum]
MARETKIITTEDGSHSIYLPEINESYHSSHGAYRESVHVFILYGLEAWFARNRGKFPIRVFEVGFGTGLNAWLSLIWAEQSQVPVAYHTIEPFPLEKEIYSALNYTTVDESFTIHYNAYFNRLHAMEWDLGKPMTEFFNIKKDQTTLQEATLYPIDVVYFDAFSPKKQPELWHIDRLRDIVDAMNPNAVFVTYCAAAQLKRDLQALGLVLDQVPGPPGKKEMTRAWKPG